MYKYINSSNMLFIYKSRIYFVQPILKLKGLSAIHPLLKY